MFLLSRLALDGSAPPLACRPTLVAEVGLVLACVFFIWRMSTLFRVEARSGEGLAL
jgi:hypothetical protein